MRMPADRCSRESFIQGKSHVPGPADPSRVTLRQDAVLTWSPLTDGIDDDRESPARQLPPGGALQTGMIRPANRYKQSGPARFCR
jgi:hypothetical protein